MATAATERARALLSTLPHVKQDLIDPFLAYLARRGMDPTFHSGRCMAFGASEVGALVRHADRNNPLAGGKFFGTAEDVVGSKTLDRFPFPGNTYTRRGQLLEPAIRYATRTLYSANPLRDGMKAILAANSTDTKLPWLRISPDDLLEIGGKVYIPDYKMPSEADTGIEDDYGWQLHTYKMAAMEKAGVHVDGILLVRGVLPVTTGLECADWLQEGRALGQQQYIDRLAKVASMFRSDLPGFGLKVEEISYDPSKGERIKEICAHYWNEYVLKGVIPSSEPTEPLALGDFEQEKLKHLQDKLSVVLAAKGSLEAQEKQLKSELDDILGSVGSTITDNSIFPQSLVKPTMVRDIDWEGVKAELERRGIETSGAVTKGKSYNTDALVKELESLEVDVTDPRFSQTTIDTKALTKLVDENDLDVSRFVGYKPRFGLGRDKNTKQAVSSLSEEFESSFSSWAESALGEEQAPKQSSPIMKLG